MDGSVTNIHPANHYPNEIWDDMQPADCDSVAVERSAHSQRRHAFQTQRDDMNALIQQTNTHATNNTKGGDNSTNNNNNCVFSIVGGRDAMAALRLRITGRRGRW